MPFLNIAQDKWKHFYVGFLMSHIFQAGLQLVGSLDFVNALWLNMLLVNIVGFGFELFSFVTKKGHAEIKDALATLSGGVASVLVIGAAQWLS